MGHGRAGQEPAMKWPFFQKKTRSLPVRRLSYQAANLQGIGTRTRQEDSFAFANAMDVTAMRMDGLLAVVADGMGGMEDGDLVSQAAVSLLLKEFASRDRNVPIGRWLHSSFGRIGEELSRRFGERGGTTMAACVLFEERLYWASVGDSFLFLGRGEGLYRLNRDQNVRTQRYTQAVRNGMLEAQDTGSGSEENCLSAFLGSSMPQEIEYSLRPLALEEGDRLLLCSDGIGSILPEEELLRCLQEDPPAACAQIGAAVAAAAREHQDNYTALVLSCGY